MKKNSKKVTVKRSPGADFTEEFIAPGKPAEPKHALRAASTSHRWTACAPSLRKSEGYVDGGNAAAMLGTGAHALAEKHVMAKKWTCDEWLGKEFKYDYDGVEKTLTVDVDMVDAINIYLGLIADIVKKHPDAVVFSEVRVSLEFIYKEMFGTADTIIDTGEVLHVIDFKYGFTPVPLFDRERFDSTPEGMLIFLDQKPKIDDLFKLTYQRFMEARVNTQLLYYAAGCLHLSAWLHKHVVLHVVQPRCFEVPNIQSLMVPVDVVEQWAYVWLRERAIATDDPNAPYVPGSHCDWCPALLDCDAARERTQLVARMEFAEVVEADAPMPAAPKEQAVWAKAAAAKLPMPTDPQKLADILRWVPVIDAFCKLATEQAMNLINTGVDVPGFKLVRKRSNRAFGDLNEDQSDVIEIPDEEVIKRLKGAAQELKVELPTIDNLYHPPKLKSPAQMEELGKDAKKIVAQVAVKPLGGLTLAIASDTREAIVKKPGSDFKDVDEFFS